MADVRDDLEHQTAAFVLFVRSYLLPTALATNEDLLAQYRNAFQSVEAQFRPKCLDDNLVLKFAGQSDAELESFLKRAGTTTP